MARKNPRIKVKGVKELYYSYNKDNQLEYFVRFKPKNTNPFPVKNYTEIFSLYDLDDKKHLSEVIRLRDYTHSKWENEGIYYIDEVTGKLAKIEAKLQEKEEQKKIDVLFSTIFEITLNKLNIVESTRKPYVANYNRHIKPYLGGTSVYDIKYKDVEAIFDRMDDPERNGTGKPILHKKSGKVIMQNKQKKLSLATKKNVLTIFRNVFKYLNEDEDEYSDFSFDPSARILRKINAIKHKKYSPLTHRLQIVEKEEMLNIVKKIYKEITKLATPTLRKNGTPKILQDNVYKTKAFFFASLMTARRISELQRISSTSDIRDDVVFIDPEKSKTDIHDSYVLPLEVMDTLEIIKDKKPFNISYGTANRNWHIMKNAMGMKNEPLRHYDFRHLFVSIMSEYYDRETLGLCISHTSGDDVRSNEHYFSIVLERKREVFEKYWELIREPIS